MDGGKRRETRGLKALVTRRRRRDIMDTISMRIIRFFMGNDLSLYPLRCWLLISKVQVLLRAL
jgi:hypothetical protein